MTADPPDNPFVGLRPFRSDEGLFFFGRRRQATELLKALHTTHFLVVVGSSGCGKSSLIQAGLIPRLVAGFLVEQRDRWIFHTLTPGDAPRARLAAAFGISERVLREEGSTTLVAALEQLPDAASHNCLLLVDQFEEIFSLPDTPDTRDEAADFVGILLALAAQRTFPIFVVLTMRSDFLGDCDVFYGLPEAINRSHYLVPRLTRPERQEAVEGPVRLFGQAIASQLVDRVLNDLGDDQDQLPVMQHALLRTWERWRNDGGMGPVDLAHYAAVGGVKDALSRDANAALDELSGEDRQLAIRVFQALTDTDESNRPVRRYARVTDLERETAAPREAIERILERFREHARSFVVLRPDRDSSDAIVHISHESLIRQWAKLRDWVESERRSRDRYLRLADQADRYSRGEEPLLRDPSLQSALDWRESVRPTDAWARRYGGDFARAMSYIAESEAQRDLEHRQEQERHERDVALQVARGRSKALALGLKAVGATALIAVGLAVLIAMAASTADKQATSRLMASYAATQSDVSRSLLYGVEAFSAAPTVEARSSLLTALGRVPNVRRFLHHHTGVVGSVAFAPDGKIAASAGQDGRVVLWDVERGTKQVLVDVDVNGAGEPAAAQGVAFTPDGQLLAMAFSDGKISLWSMATRMEVTSLTAPNRLTVLAVNSIGWLAAGAQDGTISLWDLSRGAPEEVAMTLRPSDRTDGPLDVLSVALSPTEPILASSHQDGSLWLWDLARRTPPRRLEPTSKTLSIVFSPDGAVIVSGDDDGIISVWNVRDSRPTALRAIDAQSDVMSLAVSRDGTMLAAGFDDQTVRLWDIKPGISAHRLDVTRRLELKDAHTQLVRSVAFSSDGLQLISGGWDAMVILWDVTKETLVDPMIRHQGRPIQSLVWSRDGEELAWSDADARVSRWRFADRLQSVAPSTLPQNSKHVLSFESDGRLVGGGVTNGAFTRRDVETGASRGPTVPVPVQEVPPAFAVSDDGRFFARSEQSEVDKKLVSVVAVWDLATGRELQRLPSAMLAVSLAFARDGSSLAAASGSDVVTWNLQTGEELGRLTSPERTLSSLNFSPDGSRLAAGTFERDIVIWSLQDRRLLGVLTTGHAMTIEHLVFSPDGESIASADAARDGTIRVWRLRPDLLRTRACEVANRPLTRDEWLLIGPQPASVDSCRR